MQRLNFSIVLEDANIEIGTIQHLDAKTIKRALCVASGGCIALSIKHAFPHIDVCAFDLNQAQLTQTQDKATAVAQGEMESLNIGHNHKTGINQRGRCETLFRIYRHLLEDLITTKQTIATFFAPSTSLKTRRIIVNEWKSHDAWSLVHNLTYGAQLFHYTFGTQSTQHTIPGSYPSYVQQCLEHGLTRDDAAHNPFLQHIFMGHYLADDAPAFLTTKQALSIRTILGTLEDIEDLETYDFIHLSNIFDWTPAKTIQSTLNTLANRLKPGATLTLRQLNHDRDLRPWFGPHYVYADALAAKLLGEDRSLFYNKLTIATRTTHHEDLAQ